MYLVRRLSALINASIQILGMLALYFKPRFLFDLFSVAQITIVVLLLTGLSFLFFTFIVGQGESILERLRFSLFLAVTWFANYFIFLLTEQGFLQIILLVILGFLHWLWLGTLYFYWQQPTYYQPYTLQKLANYLYLFVFFETIIAISSILINIQWPFWQIWLIIGTLAFLLHFDLFSLNGIPPQDNLVLSVIFVVLSLELYLFIHLLPGNFFFYGIIMALFFYPWFGIIRLYQQKRWQKKFTYTYLVVIGVGFLSSLITTFWLR